MAERLTGADIAWRTAISNGIRNVVGYIGGANIPLYDRLSGYLRENGGPLRHIQPRHEQGGVHIAEGMARVTGEVQLVSVTSGPGGTNLTTGLADAYADSVPIVAWTGQVARPFIGKQAFQEVDMVGVAKPITKATYQPMSAVEVQEAVNNAFYDARMGRPGPVLVDIPKDVQLEKADFEDMEPKSIDNRHLLGESPAQLQQLACLLDQAQRPYVLVGQGVILSKAQTQFLEFVEKSGVAVATTLHALRALPRKHPQSLGMPGMHGTNAANKTTELADLVIGIGCSFDDRVVGRARDYAPNAYVAHIDIDPSQRYAYMRADLEIQADAATALDFLQQRIARKTYPEWWNAIRKFQEEQEREITTPALSGHSLSLGTPEVLHYLSEVTSGNGIFVYDVGQHQMFGGLYGDVDMSSGGYGTMGFALPAAIGAMIAAPERPVYAIFGEGGFQMTMQELAVVREENLDLKMLLLNNGYLGMVRQWQEMFNGGNYVKTKFNYLPDFVALAHAYGIPAERVSSRSEYQDAIRRMVEAKGPYFLEIMVDPEENVWPMVPPGATAHEVILKKPN